MNTNKKAYLFLNGEPPSNQTLQAISKEIAGGDILVVCADGAFCYISGYFLPHVLIGDFDSLSLAEVPSGIQTIKLQPEKDFTDGHVSMEFILDKGIKDITIFGGGGKRADHTLSNYSLLAIAKKHGATAKMDDGEFFICLTDGDFEAETKKGKIISLVPYSDTVHISITRGLKYPINNRTLDKIHILGISNIAEEDTIGYTIQNGTALVFLQK